MLFLKDFMFYENYVNSVKCFYCIIKEGNLVFLCSIRKIFLDNLKL